MKETVKTKTVHFTDFPTDTIAGFIKYNFPCVIASVDGENNVLERIKIVSKDRKQDKITVKKSDGKVISLNYENLLKDIHKMLKSGIPKIAILKEDYDKYKSLIMCVEKLNKDIISETLLIDYSDKDKYYSILFPFKNGKPVKMYFFELNDDLLVINEKGFEIIIDDKFTSIEDIICYG